MTIISKINYLLGISVEETLLLEMPMRTEDDLPTNFYIFINSNPPSNYSITPEFSSYTSAYISYAKIEKDDTANHLGLIDIVLPKNKKLWQVNFVYSHEGWGPLIYDIALEYATLNGAGLTPGDTNEESDAIWVRYDTRSDVSKVELEKDKYPSLKSYFTHDEYISIYTKKPIRINKLLSLGKIKGDLVTSLTKNPSQIKKFRR